MPLTAPTLAIADNADGTGAVATLTGGDAGATNTVYRSLITQDFGTLTSTSSGSRTGPGNVAVATTTMGYYVWHALSVLAGETVVSNLVKQAITDGTTSVHYRCLTAIQSRLQALSLSGIVSGSVKVRWLPWRREQVANVAQDDLPMILISPPGQETMLGGLNSTDDIGYPVVVAFMDDDPDLTNNLARNLLWREQAISSLRESRLASVAEVEYVEVVPDVICDLRAWMENYWFSAFLCRCVARQERG